MNKVVIIPLFILSISLSACSNPITVSHTNWTCEKKGSERDCQVQFELTNSSNEPIYTKVMIRAYTVYREKRVKKLTTVGEKFIFLNIKENQTLKVQEPFFVKQAFNKLVVSAWEHERGTD